MAKERDPLKRDWLAERSGIQKKQPAVIFSLPLEPPMVIWTYSPEAESDLTYLSVQLLEGQEEHDFIRKAYDRLRKEQYPEEELARWSVEFQKPPNQRQPLNRSPQIETWMARCKQAIVQALMAYLKSPEDRSAEMADKLMRDASARYGADLKRFKAGLEAQVRSVIAQTLQFMAEYGVSDLSEELGAAIDAAPPTAEPLQADVPEKKEKPPEPVDRPDRVSEFVKEAEKHHVRPVTSFTENVTSGYAPLQVSFRDTSQGNPTHWFWVFGDGQIAYEEHPVHIYTDPGIYSVFLSASNAAGCSLTRKINLVTVKKASADHKPKVESPTAVVNVPTPPPAPAPAPAIATAPQPLPLEPAPQAPACVTSVKPDFIPMSDMKLRMLETLKAAGRSDEELIAFAIKADIPLELLERIGVHVQK